MNFGELLRYYRQSRMQMNRVRFAKLAGVSYPTLCRAESGTLPSVASTRKILGVLESGGIERRELRRLTELYILGNEGGAGGKSRGAIGLLVPTIDRHPYWGRMVSSIQTNAVESSRLVVIYQHRNDIASHCAGLNFLAELDSLVGVVSVPAYGTKEHRPDQLYDLDNILDSLIGRGIPVIFLDRSVPVQARRQNASLNAHVPYVGADNEQAAYDVIEYLVNMGHRRIAGLFDLPHVSTQAQRKSGYRKALRRYGLLKEELIKDGEDVAETQRAYHERHHGYRRGLANFQDLMGLPAGDRPTAIFCAAGHLAQTVKEAVERRDYPGTPVSIPDTLSLVGCDYLLDFGEIAPSIGHVRYDFASFGRAALTKLLTLIDDPLNQNAHKDTVIRHRNVDPRDTIQIAPTTSTSAEN